jgi:hypothetical protein
MKILSSILILPFDKGFIKSTDINCQQVLSISLLALCFSDNFQFVVDFLFDNTLGLSVFASKM